VVSWSYKRLYFTLTVGDQIIECLNNDVEILHVRLAGT